MRSCSRSEAGVVATVRFGLAGAVGGATAVENPKRLMSPQPASAIGAHSSAAAAKTRRLIPLSRSRAVPSTFWYSRSADYFPLSTSICPALTTSIRGPGCASTQPRTRIRRFSKDLSVRPLDSTDGIMRLEIVAAKSRVQLRPKFR